MRSRFLFWKALFGLLVFEVTVALGNFSHLHRIVKGWRVARVSNPLNCVDNVCSAVNLACVWYPRQVLCLGRAAVTTCLLRSLGVPAEMVIGAQKLPFA